MTPDLAIASITLALRLRLQAALNRAGEAGAEVKTERPDKFSDTGAPVVNLYLYQLNINPFLRNDDIEPVIVRTQDGHGGYQVGAERVQSWRVPLKLNYMLTFYGDDRILVPQRLLATCVAVLHRLPVIDAKAVAAAAMALGDKTDPAPPDDFEAVNLTFADLSLDDTYRLWSAFKAGYALSVGYMAETAVVYTLPEIDPVDLVLDLDLTTGLLR